MTAHETLSITVDDAKVRAAFARLKKIGTVFPAHAGMNRAHRRQGNGVVGVPRALRNEPQSGISRRRRSNQIEDRDQKADYMLLY
jgi:hypothetical protein